MAIVDSNTILSKDQVLATVTYAQRAIDLQASADYGVGRDAFVKFLIKGNFTLDLRCQIVGSDSADFSNLKVISDSGVKEAAELLEGTQFFLRFNPTNLKYRYITIRYIPTAAGTANTGTESVVGGDTPDVTNFAPPTPVGSVEANTADSIDAFIVLDGEFDAGYDYANSDKRTA